MRPAVGDQLRSGDLIALDRRASSFSDLVWEVVERRGNWRDFYRYMPILPRPVSDGVADLAPTAEDPDHLAAHALIVIRAPRLSSGARLSDDRSRIEPKGAGDYASLNEYHRQRIQNQNAQIGEQDRRVREARETLTGR